MRKLKIGVIGGGAVGLLLTAFLSEHFNVTLYTRTEQQADIIRENGIKVTGVTKKSLNPQLIKSIPQYHEEVLFVTVKQYHLTNILDELEKLSARTIIFLQNGMSHIGQLSRLKQHQLFVGVVEHGVLKKCENEVIHTGEGRIVVAPFQPNNDYSILATISEKTNREFPVLLEEEWYPLLAKKLLVNAVINPLTALWKVKNGQLVTNPSFQNTVHMLFQEIWGILELDHFDEYYEYLLAICEKTAENESSMLRDLKHGNITEVDSILGYILNRATSQNKDVPLTTFLFHSIKGLERNC